jgi:ADP-ribosylation factor-like protein 1
MGVVYSLFASVVSGNGRKESRVLILGLDNAGKTTILHRINSNTVVSTVPTVGFEVETVQINSVKIQVWDLGGQTSIRPYWRCYYPNTHGIVYVVDCTDKERFPDAKHELSLLLKEEDLNGVPLLVLANKQDMPNASNIVEIVEGLGLESISDRSYHIQGTSATTLADQGINEGMKWLVTNL